MHVGGHEAADPADIALSSATREALWAGIGALRIGGRIGEVGAAVQASIERSGATATPGPIDFGIVTGYEGHGIGRELHMDPSVPNIGGHRGPKVRAGAVVAIEPMITLGTAQTHELADDWTVVTDDGSRAAHWEHTVAVTSRGLWVLTADDGGAAELAARGLPFGGLD